jgi:hypothetical protein
MLLRASYPMDSKRSALVHELGHRLIDQLGTRPSDLDEHRVLDLFLYDYEAAWRWALSLTNEERASRFASIRRANGK